MAGPQAFGSVSRRQSEMQVGDRGIMRVQTVNFGMLEVPEDKVITFREGIPGFPQIHRFAIIEMEGLKPFRYLQSLDDPPVSFFIIDPFLVDPAYEFRLTDVDMGEISAGDAAQLAVYAVATIPDNPQDATLNLMAPIVINNAKRYGKQVVMHDSKYSVRHPLLPIAAQNQPVPNAN